MWPGYVELLIVQHLKECAGEIAAAHKGEVNDGEMSFAQALLTWAAALQFWQTKATQALLDCYFPVP